MSDSIISSLTHAISNTYIYMGIIVTIGGIFGGIINIIIFLSLRTYRQSSSASYLTVVSIINIGQLLTGLLSRVLINAVGVDWTQTSLAYCKLRNYIFQMCAIVSPMCMCLATIDQFLSTSAHPRWQRWSNTKIAYCLSGIMISFWSIYGIPYLLYYNIVVSSNGGTPSCTITNAIFSKYYNDFHVPVLMCIIPLTIMIIFGLLAYRNVKQISHRTVVPLVRHRHEVQLTIMVLAQTVFNIFATTPCFIVLTFASFTTLTQDPVIAIQVRFAIAITTCIYYLYYAIPFYIYICVSDRFRKQLHYVLFGIHLKRWRTLTQNEVLPMNELPRISVEIIPST
ncbi:unnamed protein product [Adineta steineri]|uniref:G-protein coupled receptors family 1 profile domain-containing protein n=1 Tax=Adineta steineri TaxID=433720 RepID=A0A814SCK8_9BILA|nr:unnamed protein product [Adineta steineri]CAF1145623.1 unnamed protein product [Adineta steineri]